MPTIAAPLKHPLAVWAKVRRKVEGWAAEGGAAAAAMAAAGVLAAAAADGLGKNQHGPTGPLGQRRTTDLGIAYCRRALQRAGRGGVHLIPSQLFHDISNLSCGSLISTRNHPKSLERFHGCGTPADTTFSLQVTINTQNTHHVLLGA